MKKNILEENIQIISIIRVLTPARPYANVVSGNPAPPASETPIIPFPPFVESSITPNGHNTQGTGHMTGTGHSGISRGEGEEEKEEEKRKGNMRGGKGAATSSFRVLAGRRGFSGRGGSGRGRGMNACACGYVIRERPRLVRGYGWICHLLATGLFT